MPATLRPLGPQDLTIAQALLSQRLVENLFLIAKLDSYGIDEHTLGRVHGFEVDGELMALCLDGGTVFPAGIVPAAIPYFVTALGPQRRCGSILGPSMMTLGLYLGLSTRYRGPWRKIINVRQQQPLMVLEGPPAADPDPRVRPLTHLDFEPYLAASVAMYTDEIGTSPYKHGSGYDSYVRSRLLLGDAWGWVEGGEVLFKADLGPKYGDHAQLQGVWLTPRLRGSGLAPSLLAGMLAHAQQRHPIISLYVNHFNTPAIRLYERLGFTRVGTLATVHY